MKRPVFTIETKIGTNFDANHISIGWHSNGYYGVQFICSGVLSWWSIESIKEIRFSKEGADYCGECDRPLLERG